MRLAPRLALTFGLLAAASSALVGVAVRYRLAETETKRFHEDVRGICERMRAEVNRQADADQILITGFCEVRIAATAASSSLASGCGRRGVHTRSSNIAAG